MWRKACHPCGVICVAQNKQSKAGNASKAGKGNHVRNQCGVIYVAQSMSCNLCGAICDAIYAVPSMWRKACHLCGAIYVVQMVMPSMWCNLCDAKQAKRGANGSGRQRQRAATATGGNGEGRQRAATSGNNDHGRRWQRAATKTTTTTGDNYESVAAGPTLEPNWL